MRGHDAQIGCGALRGRVANVRVADERPVVLEAGQVAGLTGFGSLPATIGYAWVRVDLRARLAALVVEAIATGQLVGTILGTGLWRFSVLTNFI